MRTLDDVRQEIKIANLRKESIIKEEIELINQKIAINNELIELHKEFISLAS